MLFVEIALLLEFRIDEIALVPPFLSECPDERQLEELEEREFEFPSQLARPTADGPSVIIDSCHATYFPQAHWIEFAGEGFLDFSASVAVSTVDGAKGGSVFCLDSENTVFPIDNAGDHLPLAVDVCHSLPFDHFTGFGHELIVKQLVSFLHIRNLVDVERCSGISFHAACTPTRMEVARETFSEEVHRDQCVLNFYHY